MKRNKQEKKTDLPVSSEPEAETPAAVFPSLSISHIQKGFNFSLFNGNAFF
jgi:hypothetical protein